MPNFIVTHLRDDGSDGSLRWALENLSGNGNVIEFAPSLSGKITLNGNQLVIANGVTIRGDDRIIIDGDNKSRIFQISNPSADFTVTLDGLTLQNGNAIYDASDPENSRGGAILTKENLTITNSQIISNRATGRGNDAGAIFIKSGGGVDKELIIKNSVISGNSARGDAGGIRANDGIVIIEDSVITDNTADGAGDAIQLNGDATGSAKNSTIHGSVASTTGDGLTDRGNNELSDNPTAALPTVDLSISPGGGSELNESEIIVTATTTDTSGGPKTVELNLSGAGVTESDFVSVPTKITIPSGQTSASVTLKIANDNAAEGNETVTVTAINPIGAELGSSPAGSFTIADDGELATVTITAAVAVNEGDAITLRAEASQAATTAQIIDVAFNNGASTASSGDLSTTTVQITIPAGETVGTATVNTVNDSQTEAAETVVFNYTTASSGISLNTTQTTTTLNASDPVTPTITLTAGTTVTEGGQITVTAELSDTVSSNQTIDITLDGSSTASDGDLGTLGQIVIPAGQLTQTLTVNVVDDALTEAAETVVLAYNLTSSGAVLSNNRTTTTIAASDLVLPTVALTATSAVTEGDDIILTATANTTAATDRTIAVALDGTASAGSSDLTTPSTTITIKAGETSGTATVKTVNDSVAEPTEFAVFRYTPPEGVNLTNTTTSTSITDDDGGSPVGKNRVTITGELVQVDLSGGANGLKFDLSSFSLDGVSQVQVLETDATGKTLGTLGSFSLLSETDLGGFSPTYIVDTDDGLASGDFLKVVLIGPEGSVMGSPLAGEGDRVNLSFGNKALFGLSLDSFGAGANVLEANASGDETFDLTGLSGTVTATFSIYREATFDNVVGLYRTNANGDVLDEMGTVVATVGATNYEAAALTHQVGVDLSGQNGQKVVVGNVDIVAGGYLSAFLIANPSGGDRAVYFSRTGANSDGQDHSKILGNNTIGFEDMAGLGDADYDDVIVSVALA